MGDFEPNLALQELRLDTLSLQEKVFLSAISQAYQSNDLTGPYDRAVTTYTVLSDGTRVHNVKLTQPDIDHVIKQFNVDPKRAYATGRNNLLAILNDQSGGDIHARKDRLGRYLTSYFGVMEKLDHAAFPPQEDANNVQSGVPDYIPDGLSDMGSDPRINPAVRLREKIRVDKKGVFEQEKQFLTELFGELQREGFDVTDDPKKLEAMKKMIIGKICNHVYKTVKYDYAQKLMPQAHNRSILTSEYDKEGVCRHKAMRAQLMFQEMGIASRLLKCDLDGQPHVANLVRLNHRWYLVDPTNPVYHDSKTDRYSFGGDFSEVSLDDIQQQKEITFTFPVDKGNPIVRRYKARSNMYYRILKN